MLKTKKAQGVSINSIVIAAIILVILVISILLIRGDIPFEKNKKEFVIKMDLKEEIRPLKIIYDLKEPKAELKKIYILTCPYNENVYLITDYYKSLINYINDNPKYDYCKLEMIEFGEEIKIE